jgi:hypothetical protein
VTDLLNKPYMLWTIMDSLKIACVMVPLVLVAAFIYVLIEWRKSK